MESGAAVITVPTLRRQLTITYDRILAALQDVSPDEAQLTPSRLAPIVWQVGHIALADKHLPQRAGIDVRIPAHYEALFRRGSSGRGGFPDLGTVLRFFESAQEDLMALANEESLGLPARHPYDAYHTVGEGLLFALYHRGYHHGKIMTLRALLGKPALL